jgi:hypothetical protein
MVEGIRKKAKVPRNELSQYNSMRDEIVDQRADPWILSARYGSERLATAIDHMTGGCKIRMGEPM